MDSWRDFHGANQGYILELYERYQKDPTSVDPKTRAYFKQWTPPTDGQIAVPAAGHRIEEIVGAVNFAQAIREYGHLQARLDPLGSEARGDPALSMEAHGLSEEVLSRLPASLIGGPITRTASNALEAVRALQEVYTGSIGYDYSHVHAPEKRDWLRNAAESRRFRPTRETLDPVALLDRLTQVEAFEQFLHRTFPGKHRFSIEGLDMMIPMLDQIICTAAGSGINNVLLGMAHRGRLNVLTHLLQKSYAQILAEFKDPIQSMRFRDDLGWTGDVKYHKGAYRAVTDEEPCSVPVTLAPNPSHLELINPVIEGMTRAAGTSVDQPGAPRFDPLVTLPLLVHGDAAFPGQGVVAETINLSRLRGYWTGGTIHIISNNQLGYTATSEESRSTLYASDLAKGFKVPVVHVNADDPEACIEAACLAFAFRQEFGQDFLIDLVGYRRYGHNEGDEPGFTQPRMYQVIRNHPTIREQWAKTLAERGTIKQEQADGMVRQRMDDLQRAMETLNPERDYSELRPEPAPPGTARRVKTAVPIRRLQALNKALLTLPEGFTPHPKLARAMSRRLENLADADNPAVDWSTAEELAFASILEDGIAIRLTGEDTERGTFSQRHAVFHDVETGETFIPQQGIPQAKAAFEVYNSPLSEMAALGFEYGYNIQEPGRLVLWEAQYGDFINMAQAVVDEFLVSARAKWGQTPSLVLLLPHGHEGAGPDHSSGRLERFLHMAGEKNIRIANCTTAAQYFHLLRRQALLLKTDPLPLVIMTPKSLLRHPMVASSLRDLAEGRWQPVLDDKRAQEQADQIRRLFLCSGKVYIDLVSSKDYESHPEIAIVRVEQLYPFPNDDVEAVIKRYANLEEVVWVQEEPENMGAWSFVLPILTRLFAGRVPLRYVGRAASSSPAEGSAAWHTQNQETLIRQAFDQGPDQIMDDFIIS